MLTGGTSSTGQRDDGTGPVIRTEDLTKVYPGADFAAVDRLNLSVEAFEARDDQGRDSAPLAVVRVHATLVSNQTHAVLADRIVSASVRASDNRQGPIVGALQAGVRDVIGQLVALTSQPRT